MATRRRRRYSRSFAGKRGGRQYWWLRLTPFGVPLASASTATHADIMLSQSDWEDPVAALNSTQRGGARLERLIMDFGLSTFANANFYSPSGDANIASIPEFLVWKQSDQFVSVVTNSSSFSQTRDSQRVIMDEIPNMESTTIVGGTSATLRTVRGRFETKSKVRLADASIGVAWRGLFDTGSANLTGYTDWVRPTILISVP